MYVHQQRVTYPGTPLQFMERVQGFASQQSRGLQDRPGPLGDLGQVVEAMGLDRGVLGQQWSQLSVSAWSVDADGDDGGMVVVEVGVCFKWQCPQCAGADC